MTKNKTKYVRMAEARTRDEKTNGRVIKPFKSKYGEKDLFINKELVSIAKIPVEDEGIIFTVTGVSFDVKKQTFNIKSSIFTSEEDLNKYVKVTGEIVEFSDSTKIHTFKSKFISKGTFKSLNGFTIPKDTIITKIVKVQGGGLLEEVIFTDELIDAIIDNEKLSMYCSLIEEPIEIMEK